MMYQDSVIHQLGHISMSSPTTATTLTSALPTTPSDPAPTSTGNSCMHETHSGGIPSNLSSLTGSIDPVPLLPNTQESVMREDPSQLRHSPANESLSPLNSADGSSESRNPSDNDQGVNAN